MRQFLSTKVIWISMPYLISSLPCQYDGKRYYLLRDEAVLPIVLTKITVY